MSTTIKGFIIILVVGLVVLAVAALVDRRNRRRREGHLRPDAVTDQTPTYQTLSQLQRHTSTRPLIGDATLQRLHDAPTFALRLAAPELATHDGQRSLATDTQVLICDDPVSTVRELLPIFALLPTGQALTVVAPSFSTEVIDMGVANLAAGTRLTQPLIGELPARTAFAQATGAVPQPRAELQAGGVTKSALGRAALVLADATETRVDI